MVHSGPFNGLCEIESSRGSPGISNIFLPMLQLLRTISPLFPPPLPPPSRLVVPPYRRLLHISPPYLLRRYYPTKAAHPHRSSSSRFSAGISQLPAEDSQRMRADFRISVTEKAEIWTRAGNVARILSPTYILCITSAMDTRKRAEI